MYAQYNIYSDWMFYEIYDSVKAIHEVQELMKRINGLFAPKGRMIEEWVSRLVQINFQFKHKHFRNEWPQWWYDRNTYVRRKIDIC